MFCTTELMQACVPQAHSEPPIWLKQRLHSQAVVQMHKNGDTVARFDSISRAKSVVPKTAKISECCYGSRETCGDYVWRFEDPAAPQTKKAPSRVAIRLAHVKPNGERIGPLIKSANSASAMLKEKFGINISQSTITRSLKKPPYSVDLRPVGSKTVHSRLRQATEVEVSEAGDEIAINHISDARVVSVFKLDGENNRTLFKTLVEAANSVRDKYPNVSETHISEAARGLRDTAYGHKWVKA
jgi:hypothetical protein